MGREDTVHQLVGGRYALLEPLGRGGMGTVWRAHDELLQRKVAVKHVAIPPALQGPERTSVRDRVMREAQAAARLSHPASVTVFDVLEDDGSVYIVMELVEADTLAQHVEGQGPVEPAEAARLGLELLGALEAAHRQGIVHRDVKPSNVMLLPTGAVKLTDFGIASLKDHPSLTSTGQVLGSPSYMAPEQALGHQSGEEVDWWGLGATLYYALEGRPPFDRPGALPTLTAVVNEDPAPTERAGPMSALLGRLLAKDPKLRPGGPELRKLLCHHAGSTDDERRDNSASTAQTPAAVAHAEPAAPAPAAAAPATPAPAAPAAAATSVVPAPVRQIPPTEADVPSTADTFVSAPEPQPSARSAPLRGPSRSRAPAVAALLAVIAVLVGLVYWGSRPGDDPDPEPTASEPTASEPTASEPTAPVGEPGTTATSAPSDDRPTTLAPESAAAGVPEDWVEYTDPKVGYRVAHPPAWQVRQLDGTRTDIVDPSTGSYLRLDWTDTPGPSPEGAWEAQSKSFGSRHEGYQELRIEPTTFKGFDAAIWEYAYSARGGRLHAVNLGMVTGTHGFALNFQTSEDRWEASQQQFEAFKASFRVPD